MQSTLVAADGDETTALLMYDSATRPVPNAPGADCVTVVDGRLTTLKIIFDSVPFAAARAALAVRSEWANDGLDAQRLAPRVTARFDFSTFPTLATDRLVLREFRVDDAGDLFAFRSDADEQKYNNEPLTHVDQAVAMIADLHAGYAAQTAIPWAVASRDDDRVMACSTTSHGSASTVAPRSAMTWREHIGAQA